MVRCFTFAAVLLVLAGGSARANSVCVLDVRGDEPVMDVEKRQPFRLAKNPITLPGYDGLLLRPHNRGGLYEIVGTDYQPLPQPAPGSSFLDLPVYAVRGGWHILLGWNGRIVWGLPPGSNEWQRLEVGERWNLAAYDQGARDLYVTFGRDRPVTRWNGAKFVPSEPMPTVAGSGNAVLSEFDVPLAIRTIPDVGGTLAIGVNWSDERQRSLWFQPPDGEWRLIADQTALAAIDPNLKFPAELDDVDLDPAQRTIRVFTNSAHEAVLLLRRSGDSWTLADAIPGDGWVEHEPSGARLAWIGNSSQDLIERRLFWSRTIEPKPPVLNVLAPGTLDHEPIEDVLPYGSVHGSPEPRLVTYFATIEDIQGINPLLVEGADGWYAFDGTSLNALPALRTERVGELARIRRVGPSTLIQSRAGMFLLTDDLEAERVETFPIEQPWPHEIEIAFVEGANMFVVAHRRSGDVYVSTDLEQFARVPTPARIHRIVGSLPDRPGLLLVGADGLYTFEGSCPRGIR